MRGLTRRRFCAGTALAGASASALLTAASGCDPGSNQPPARTLAGFHHAVGTGFTLPDGAGLRLAQVRVHAPPIRRPEPRGESFTLVFEADRPMALAQASHQVRHGQLGAFSIFLVPRGAAGPGGLPTYAATYCRL